MVVSMMNLEYPQVYRSAQRKARKQHRCCECLGMICKGEVYNYVSGIWDGSPSSYKTCPDCYLLRFQLELEEKRENKPWDEGICLGGMMEWLYEKDKREAAVEFGKIIKRRGAKWKFNETMRGFFQYEK